MVSSFSLQNLLRPRLALAVLAGGVCVAAGAQIVPPAAPVATSPVPAFAATDGAQKGSELYSSSGASDALDSSSTTGTTATQMNLASLENGIKPPGVEAQYGRRRYGAPRYRGSNTNADGSAKYTAYVGAGFTVPVTAKSNYLTTSYGLQAGAGRNFNKHLGVNFEFDYDHFGMTGATIAQQAYLYDPLGQNGVAGNLDANSHIWSFSIQPIYQIYSGEGLGVYLTGGVGFYHKVANFTLPQQVEQCYYYCAIYTANENVDHYSSNAPGYDGGIGITYKFSHFSSERFYAEGRYVYIDNSARTGDTVATALTYAGYNYFPQNSNKTSYFPIKLGVRF